MAKKAVSEPGSTGFEEAPLCPEPEPTKKARKGGPIMDEEMKVMNAINRAISKLPSEAARIRVLRYMTAKLEFPLIDGAKDA